MNSMRGKRRPRKYFVILAILVVVLAPFAPTLWGVARARFGASHMSIPGAAEAPASALSHGAGPASPIQSGPPFVTSVSPSKRFFLDQYGKPMLVKGDSPWSLVTRMSPAQAESWFSDREKHGYNAAIISLIGATANGAPSDDGATYDGALPFVDHDILSWNDSYWRRAHDYVQKAANHGITVLLYPIDGWIVGHSFVPKSQDQCRTYGERVAAHFKDLPNIVWMTGGDYFPTNKDADHGSDVDRCMDGMMQGVRSTGDSRPFSIQLGHPKDLSTDDPFWAPRVDWNFVYTYSPTYRGVLRAYDRQPIAPALLGESNYEGENNTGGPPTTNESLRRQILWALTSGAAGDFAGSRDWKFDPGWEQRLDTEAVRQISTARQVISELPWWQLAPDRTLITSGQGTPLGEDREADVLDSDYATAARTASGDLAVVYIPTERTVTVDRQKLSGDLKAAWIDPTTGARRPTPISATFTTPGRNADGGGDWLLVLSKA